jgi:starch synthase (maltosyl-transferring)
MDGAIRTASEVTGPRIRYVDLRRHDLADAANHASEQGFTHVMIPPPWAHAPRGSLMLATDLSQPDAVLGAGWSLEEAVSATALPVLMDVVVDSVACRSAAGAAGGGVFADPDPAAALDPRRAVDTDAAAARLATPADAAALGAFWEARLAAWSTCCVAGFRLLGLQACPAPLLKPLITALRRGAGNGLLLAWTPGMNRDAIAALAGLGLDGLFGSLPWWDFSTPWLWDECQAIRRAGPLIGCADVPNGRRLGAGSPARRRSAQSLAATIGSGWMDAAGDTGEHATCLNAWRRESPALSSLSAPLLPAGSSTPLLSLVRFDTGDLRVAERASLILINTDAALRRSLPASALTTALGGRFICRAAGDPIGETLRPQDTLTLDPGEARAFMAEAVQRPVPSRTLDRKAAGAATAPSLRLAIEAVTPAVDGGAFPVKRTAGEVVSVEADVIFDGHEKIAVTLRWRAPGDDTWQEVPMTSLGNDRWTGAFPLDTLGLHRFSIMAWKDRFATFRDELAKKAAAGITVKLECIEGEQLVRAAIKRSKGQLAAALEAALAGADLQASLLSEGLAALMARADDRPFATECAPMPVDAERIGARYASWYEIFPRSMSDDESRHGSFADVQRHLPRIRDMGFDVLYFPPIHPIGLKNRKGRNNTLTPAPDDPGSPYAIGSADGGHDAIHPQLGTFADFRALREAAEAAGIELAIDFAIQCSPDHPWLKNHPGWFDWRPDGSIRYAENPPKKYEDIVNVDFYAEAAIPDLWIALCDTVLFWAGHGVRLFRVDNPHTKAFPFWQWMIAEVKRRYPDAIFLAEAFTRPKVMYRLAKIGFSQSYTYFTWRNTKAELADYFTELASGPPRDFFRPHLFVNTPDINPPFLQTSGRPGFLIRAALAATLSGLWGVYCGFELCEATPVPGREEYLDSEKYQLRAWDWDRPGNIAAEITALNAMRRTNPALQTHLGVSFLAAPNDLVLVYEKATPDRSNVVLAAVSMDPLRAQESDFDLPLWKWRLPDNGTVQVEDLVTGARFTWSGRTQRVRLTQDRPYAIWRVRPAL